MRRRRRDHRCALAHDAIEVFMEGPYAGGQSFAAGIR
jgi:hypothetical protein